MIILLIIYFLFLLAYVIFNAYAVIRVWSLKLPHDMTPLTVLIYLIVMAVIVTFSLVFISNLNWQSSFGSLLGIGG